MKKVIIGCWLSLLGALGNIAVLLVTSDIDIGSWSTPPGRFLTAVSYQNMTLPLMVSCVLLVLGLLVLVIEYFRKD